MKYLSELGNVAMLFGHFAILSTLCGFTAIDAAGETVVVSTVADLTAAVAGTADEIVLLQSGSPYMVTSKIAISRAVTLRGETGNPADVVIDGSGTSGFTDCTALVLDNAGAVIDGITFKSCKAENAGGGVRVTGGLIRNCVFDNGYNGGNSGCSGCGVYINGSSAVVSNCIVRSCHNGLTGGGDGIGAYITGGGTLSHTLVTGCYRGYATAVDSTGIVYLKNGTVKNCTIADNTLATSALYVDNNNSCIVKDTICWGNAALREWREGRPNIAVGGTNAKISNVCVGADIGTEPILGNPMFADGSYTLMPGSPCIGAGTDGCDLGYKPFDATKTALGISVGAFKGVGELTTTVTLTASGAYDLTGASVIWDGLEETGASITHAFGPGKHSLTANVTFANASTATVTLADAITVGYTGVCEVATAAELKDVLATPADGLVIRLAEGTYALTESIGLYDNVKIIGAGLCENTIIDLQSKSRVLNIGHKDALVAGVTLQGGKSERDVGGVYIHGNGGTVSNCVVSGCTCGTNCKIGGVHLNATNALFTHSRVKGCWTNGKNAIYATGGVRISKGTIADSIITGNSSYGSGAGVYLDTNTTDAKVVNCTISGNTSSGAPAGGLYRVNGGGYVYNTIVYGNSSSSGEVNIGNGGGDAATRIFNCASDKAFGTDGVVLATPPYDPVTYELDPVNGASCINHGTNDYVVSTLDFFGNQRIFNNVVDIGASEYAKTDVVPGITPSATERTGAGEMTFTATVQGAELGDYTATWYLDGSAEPNYTGYVYTTTLGVGRHAVRLVINDGRGQTYEHSEEAGFVTVYPTDAYVDVASTTAAWPFDTPETAASNLNEAVSQTLRSGVTLHIAEGDYRIASTITVGREMSVIGAGRDATCVYSSGAEAMRVFVINGRNALVSSLCVSNALEVQGGVCIRGDGGTFADGKIVECRGTVNQEGAGLMIENSNGRATRCVIANNSTYLVSGADSSGVDHTGAGAVVRGGILENSLIVGNKARNAAGVMVDLNGTLRNCTVVGNTASPAEGNTHEGCGGVVVRSGSAVNCIIVGNYDALVGNSADAAANAKGGGFSHCCILGDTHTGCVAADPRFKDAANGDYRIRSNSPCANTGLYQNWMPGETDFFGNPRATPGGKVSIGFHQVAGQALKLLVK